MEYYQSYMPHDAPHEYAMLNQSGLVMTHAPQHITSLPPSSYRVHPLHPDVAHRISHESKPRLSKEQQDILENAFKQQAKPSTSTKKQYAESLGVPLDKVNVSVRHCSVLHYCTDGPFFRTGSRIVAQR